MEKEAIGAICARQKEYFQTGATQPVSFRLRMLSALEEAVRRSEDAIASALFSDLGKSATESYMCEIGMVYAELSYMKKHTARFARPKRVRTPIAQFPAKSYTVANPYGSVLIMSPWNYPFLLTVGPLIDALAAGNCAVVKPSAYAPATAACLARLLEEVFPPEYVAVVLGGREENTALLEQKFDLVFFTGSSEVGKTVLRHTAEHLTPAVLELGGKSPVIVDASADIPLAARRIVFGKLLNCGQTCVAPDYVLCDEKIKDTLLSAIVAEIKAQLGEDPLSSPEYGRIVNEKHFHRLSSLIDPEKTVVGGVSDAASCRIAPTVMTDVTFDDPVMGEEIFGPILPLLAYRDFSEICDIFKDKPKPLALYLFSNDRSHIRFVRDRLLFGGGCINDTVIHLATEHMGFGGVGESGMGSYHGQAGFDCFSHKKSIVEKRGKLDLPMRYHPYTPRKTKLIRRFLK